MKYKIMQKVFGKTPKLYATDKSYEEAVKFIKSIVAVIEKNVADFEEKYKEIKEKNYKKYKENLSGLTQVVSINDDYSEIWIKNTSFLPIYSFYIEQINN